MKTLLALQDLDLKIERCKRREKEIPLQKKKYEIHKVRLADELRESEERCKTLAVEQRECEGDIEQKQEQVKKYDGQLLAVKKNEEYQALLHEIDTVKKQIALKEERIITLMVEADEAKAHLEEDKQRIEAERAEIERECGRIDEELQQAIAERKELEAQRAPLIENIDPQLLSRYRRIRKAKKEGKAVVPLENEACSGCHMRVTPQMVNEILAGEKTHACSHCGRLLYEPGNFHEAPA